MKYRCSFFEPYTNEQKIITVALSAAEVRSIEAMRAARNTNADVHAEAHALRRAFAEVPEGFMHDKPPELMQ